MRPGDTLGDYQIERVLGHGGMAVVYLAHQRALDRLVAIKVLPDFLAEEEGSASASARRRSPSPGSAILPSWWSSTTASRTARPTW